MRVLPRSCPHVMTVLPSVCPSPRSLVDLPDPGLSLDEPSSTGMSCMSVDLGLPATTKGSVTWSSILSSSVERSVLSSVTPVSMTPSDSFLSGSFSGGQVKHC